MKQLLDYCERKEIKIKKFLHTSFQTPEFLKAAIKSIEAEQELVALFKKVKELWKVKKLIEYQSYVTNENSDLCLSNDIKLRFLAPSTVEFDMYISNISIFSDQEIAHNNANANWLSTIIKIFSQNWYILLTSDCEKTVLKYLGIKKNTEFNSNILLGQSPHHGAFVNHNGSFWKLRLKKDNTPIVFSVGNNNYNHPSSEVIKSFNKYNYTIYSTNITGGFLNDDSMKELIEINSLLNLSSDIISEDETNSILTGDKTFVIDNDLISYIPS